MTYYSKSSLVNLLASLCLITLPTISLAAEAENNSYLPKKFITISKEPSYLYVLENQDTVEIKKAFPSIHGEIDGDKLTEGDLRTPEGVYFITTKIHTELDWEKYGSGAYALNYPNPVDRLKQKTGFGIWIHSKGNPIEGQVTQGCVAVDLDDFASLAEDLPAGMPVVIADSAQATNINTLILEQKEITLAQKNSTQTDITDLNSTATEEAISTPSLETNEVVEEEIKEEKKETLVTQAIDTARTLAGIDISRIQPKPKMQVQVQEEQIANTSEDTQISTDEATEQETTDSSVATINIENNIEDSTALKSESLVQLTKDWNTAWASRSAEFFDFYNPEKYTLAQSESFHKFKEQKEYLFKMLPWIQIIHGNIYALKGTDYWVTWFEQFYRAPNLSTEGTRRLYWQKDEAGSYKVVAMEWIPKRIGLEELYMASIQPEIEATIESWKLAWENADVEKYASYYTANAVQGARQGQEIFDQKADIWTHGKQPELIEFTDLKVTSEGSNVRVTMKQRYADLMGYSDYGVKSILFVKEDNQWKIAREDWWNI